MLSSWWLIHSIHRLLTTGTDRGDRELREGVLQVGDMHFSNAARGKPTGSHRNQ